MPRVASRAVAAFGLLALAVVAVGLLQGSLTVGEAAVRGGAVLALLLLVDRVLLPVAREVVGRPRRDDDEGEAEAELEPPPS